MKENLITVLMPQLFKHRILHILKQAIGRFYRFTQTDIGKALLIDALVFIFFWHCLPSPLFRTHTSTVIEDSYGNLMGAKIADDGQWRFPYNHKVPEKFQKALVQFEDRYFYYHFGFNPWSFCRAMKQNYDAGKVVCGGSTITMQVVRLMRKGKKRTFFEKFVELIMATRMELTYSKSEILALYAANAPFGSNVVGLDAASWRYFGRSPDKLSWAEMATLAVLPNSPSLIYPGKNSKNLLRKRNRLLDRLKEAGYMDESTCEVSKEEPLPGKPYPIPQFAPHLLDRAIKDGYKGKSLRTTLSLWLQQQVEDIVESHHTELAANDINNAAALVLDVRTGNVLAYVGNTKNPGKPEMGSDVDVITAPRSTGSVLKPFLYAAMLNDGNILPNTLVQDVPTQLGGYAPENYNKTYDGAVPAKRALARSLNIPAVWMLYYYGIERFNFMLRKIGMTTLDKPASYYGLSLILGGAEGKLWDIAGIYASMARTLNNYFMYGDKYLRSDFHPPQYIAKGEKKLSNRDLLNMNFEESSYLGAAPIWLTFEAMVEASRPDEEYEWQQFMSSAKIAWKTGTSYGYRDGWAIGVNPQYVVAVWVGNADGEGRPGLTGVGTAAPIMFDIFKLLKPSGWFSKPYDDMCEMPVCRYSGYRASDICEYIDTVWVQKSGLKTKLCPFHQIIHLDPTETWRVNSDCESVSDMVNKSWFVLPPVQEWYFKLKNSFYKVLPPYRDDCATQNNPIKSMDIVYPQNLSKIYVPVELSGEQGKVIFKVVHRNADAKIYWHLDDQYLGCTTGFHQMGLSPEPGMHTLTLVDQNGETLIRRFEIMGKEKSLKVKSGR